MMLRQNNSVNLLQYLYIYIAGKVVKRRNQVGEANGLSPSGPNEDRHLTIASSERTFLTYIPPVAALVASLGAHMLWTANVYVSDNNSHVGIYILVLITPILISAGWVANFLSSTDRKEVCLMEMILRLRYILTKVSINHNMLCRIGN